MTTQISAGYGEQAGAPAAPGRGPYASHDFPFLGAVAAICCSWAERRLFWEVSKYDIGQPLQFCKARYGLSDGGIRVLVGPAAQMPRPCPPDDDDLRAVVGSLSAELVGKAPHPGPRPIEPPFDPDLVAKYPTVTALYTSYEAGAAPVPSDWERALLEELRTNRQAQDNWW
jgi:hypothetical protein